MYKKIFAFVVATSAALTLHACGSAPVTGADSIVNSSANANETTQNDTASQDSTEPSDTTVADSVADFHNTPVFICRKEGEEQELILDDASKEKFPAFSSSWYNYMNTSKKESSHYIRRCDSHYVSVLAHSTVSTGGANDSDAYTSKNYDIQTGKEISFDDVISDKEALTSLILDQLENNPEGSYSAYPEIVDSIADNIDNPTWTLDADGITLILGPYVNVGPFTSLNIPIFIPYSSDLINKDYSALENTGYITSLVPLYPFSCDLGNDGSIDTVSFCKDNKSDGILININDNSSVIEKVDLADEWLDGYLAVTAGGKHFLLLEGESPESFMNVIDIDDGTPAVMPMGKKLKKTLKLDEDEIGYLYIPTNTTTISLSCRFDLLSTYDAYKIYSFTEDGRFVTEDPYYMINMFRPLISEKEIACEVVDQAGEVKGKDSIPSLTDYTLYRTDGYNFVDAMVGDGKIIRLNLEHTDSDGFFSININGVPAEDLFEMLYYRNN